MADVSVVASDVANVPQNYKVPGAQEILLKAVSATVNGSNATGSFLPALQLLDPAGHVMFTAVNRSNPVAAGRSALISWFPGGGIDQASGASSGSGTSGGITNLTSTGASISVTAPTGPTTNVDVSATAVTPGSYGDSAHVGTFTVGADGRLTAAGSSAISGIAITQSYIGYNTIGGTTEASSASTWKAIAKQVTLANPGLLVSIDVYCKGNASNVGSLMVGVADDNANTPGKLVAMGPWGETNGSTTNLNIALNATPRWVASPLSAYLAAGTYWLVIVFGAVGASALTVYRDGSGGDYTVNAYNATWANFEVGTTFVSGTNKYSIRGSIVS